MHASVSGVEGAETAAAEYAGNASHAAKQQQSQKRQQGHPRERKKRDKKLVSGSGPPNRKPNANYLLNVSFRAMEADENHRRSDVRPRRRGSSGFRKGSGYGTNVYISQTQYLNARHHFLMFSGPSVRACLADPDYPVEWNDVDVVIVGVDENDNRCPICLCPAVCPRVTRCGHIYCFACVLRHFGSERKYKASCPMCYEPITHSELRGVVMRFAHPLAVGYTSRFVLVRRKHTSLVPLSASLLSVAKWDADLDEEPREGWRSSDLSRVAIANPSSTIERLSFDGKTLCQQHQDCQSDVDMEALPYIEWAMEIVEEQMKSVINHFPSLEMTTSSTPPAGFEGGVFNAVFEQQMEQMADEGLISYQDRVGSQQDSAGTLETMLEGSNSLPLPSPPPFSGKEERKEDGCKRSSGIVSHHDELQSEKDPTSHLVGNLIADEGTAAAKNRFGGGSGAARHSSQPTDSKQEHQYPCPEPPPRSLSFFNFYQLSDGVTLAFLHPLCIRSVLEEYGNDPLALPAFIEACVLEVERFRLTKEVKSRYSFLRHLPELCTVAFVELDFTEILSREMLEKFRPEILKRERRRKSLLKREKALHARTVRKQRDKVEAEHFELMKNLRKSNFPILMGDGASSSTLVPRENEDPELQQQQPCLELPEGEEGWLGERNSTTMLRTGSSCSSSLPSSSFRNRLLNQIPDNFEDFPSLVRHSPKESLISTGPPRDDIQHHHSSPPSSHPPTWVVSSPITAISDIDSPSKRLTPLPIGRKKRGSNKGVKMSLLSNPKI